MDGSRVVILVADDEASVRDLIALFCRSDGHHVLVASDGTQALNLACHHDGQIDLLISDISMPGMDGITLAGSVVQERPTTKVLLMSGTRDVIIPPGFGFLRKPFGLPLLRKAILDLVSVNRKTTDSAL